MTNGRDLDARLRQIFEPSSEASLEVAAAALADGRGRRAAGPWRRAAPWLTAAGIATVAVAAVVGWGAEGRGPAAPSAPHVEPHAEPEVGAPARRHIVIAGREPGEAAPESGTIIIYRRTR